VSMADAKTTKKYYWLKLKRDFFKRHDIRIIESQPNGKDYVLFYLKMLVESIDHEGELRFSDAIPYDESMLSVITNTNVDIVRAAMTMFINLHMIELLDDKTIFMSEVERLTGSETATAVRVRKHRAINGKHPALLQCNSEVTKCNTEKEKEKEIETEIEGIRGKPALKRFAPPAIDDVKAYCVERKNTVDPEHWFSYYEANGWMVGRNKMKDWKASVRTWEKNEFSGAGNAKPQATHERKIEVMSD
jgi:predicted phage replisome organizer